ncbi:MAG: ABC transporter permease [Chitinophagaceae bacterium]|nr:ABC transporter permease [Chitinophagaceae bacterium]
MFKNYFLIAIRSFKKDRVNSLISLSGLIIGLTCVMLVAGYIRYETSFDKNYSHSSRIYRIISTNNRNDYGRTELIPTAFAPALVREIPGIKGQTQISTWTKYAFLNNQFAGFKQTDVDSSFFSIFNFKFIHGNPQTALNNPDNIVLTATTAKKIYNTLDVVGKTLTTKSETYIVSGVVQDMPQNSFLQTDAFHFRPRSKYSETLDISDGYTMGNAFILLDEKLSAIDAGNKIREFCHRYKMDNYKMELQPVQQVHLHSSDIKDQSDEYNIGNLQYVYIYAAIALLILIIGCISFINLAIARSMERTKEVGVRKVMGAGRKQLIVQFLGESWVYFIIAFSVALVLAVLAWNGFTQLINIQAGRDFLLNIYTVQAISGICIFSCLLSGFYPAVFLSSLRPVITLRGGYQNVKFNFGLRKALVVMQFTITIMLIATTLVVHSQLNYLNNKPLGFNKDNLISFNIPYLDQIPLAFKDKLLQGAHINSLTFSSLEVGNTYGMGGSMRDPKTGNDSTKLLQNAIIDGDLDFMKTFQIPVIEGRDFSPAYPSDITDYNSIAGFPGVDKRRPLIVSESLVKNLGIKNPLGTVLDQDYFLKGTIIGVFKSFSVMSLKNSDPLIAIRCEQKGRPLTHVYARINAQNTPESIRYISEVYKQFFPEEIFDFSFVEGRIAHLYDTEIRLTKLINLFALLAILLSCTGLFSLVSLMVRKRTKEIGIRKVIGASVNNIVVLIGKDFLWLIIISFIIATPLAYIAMTKWLQSYANRTTLYWWIFLVAGIAAFLIAFISISFKSVAAAVGNPVKALRTE